MPEIAWQASMLRITAPSSASWLDSKRKASQSIDLFRFEVAQDKEVPIAVGFRAPRLFGLTSDTQA